MDYFNSLLPLDISSDILARLPTESVLDSKLVCTRWRYIVSHHPSFSKLQFHHSSSTAAAAAQDSSCKFGFLAFTVDNHGINTKFHYFEYNEEESVTPIPRIRRVNLVSPVRSSRIIGSHNGLICLAETIYPDICICNPITREFVLLPEIDRDWHGNYYDILWTSGFGYVSSTDEYKVLVVVFSKETGGEVYIYTLGSGTGWQNLGNFGFPFNGIEDGVFANGALYWMMDWRCGMIATFDLAEEKFCEPLSLPPMPTDNFWFKNRIGVLNGFLTFANRLGGEEDALDEIWLLKKKKNDNHAIEVQNGCKLFGWTKEFRVGNCELLAVTNRDGVLTNDFCHLSLYDEKNSTSKRLVKFRDLCLKVIPHRNTFISLKELGEEDTIVMESIKIEETKSREQLQDEDADPEYIYL